MCSRQVAIELMWFFFVIPFLMGAVTILLGFLLAVVEDWSYLTAVQYVISVQVGMASPIGNAANASPTTYSGMIFAYIISVWVLGFTGAITTVVGWSHVIDVVTRVGRVLGYMLKKWVWRLGELFDRGHTQPVRDLKAHRNELPVCITSITINVLFTAPAVILLVCLASGPGMAALEGWNWIDGLMYLLQDAAGLPNPLVAQTPTRTGSQVLCIYISALTYQVSAIAIGLGSELAEVAASVINRRARQLAGAAVKPVVASAAKVASPMGRTTKKVGPHQENRGATSTFPSYVTAASGMVVGPTTATTGGDAPLRRAPSLSAELSLPVGWNVARAPDGRQYYYHAATRRSQWTFPRVTVVA